MRIWELPRRLAPGLLPRLFSAVVLGLAWRLGRTSSQMVLAALLALGGAFVLLRHPPLGLGAIILSALLFRMDIGTGTEVSLVPVALAIPAVGALWLLERMRQGNMSLVRSRVNLPLALFLASGGLSLLAGNALWDPAVPYSSRFILVQLAQLAIFGLSALAFWLTGNLVQSEQGLRRLVLGFLAVAGALAVLRVLPASQGLANRLVTHALIRAPFWVLLAAMAGGQLLFNPGLTPGWRLFLCAALAAVVYYAFHLLQEAASNWVGVAAVAGSLAWLRWPRLRWPIAALVLAGIALGTLWPAVYGFAGGDAEWQLSGGARLALIERVVQLTMRNPITGLGPAAYRPYGFMQPLAYGRTVWTEPRINSHNNYVDLFSQTGLLGLGLFLWFMVEVAALGLRLRARFSRGLVAGYVNAMLAAWVGIMVVMMLADWFLPFVYNIGFPGLQASVLVWMFLGGLVAVENLPATAEAPLER